MLLHENLLGLFYEPQKGAKGVYFPIILVLRSSSQLELEEKLLVECAPGLLRR
jgi:hypothetical protein